MNNEIVFRNALMTLLYFRLQNRKKKRKWVKALNKERLEKGVYYTLYPELRSDSDKFFNFTKMMPETYEELLKLVTKDLRKKDTFMRNSIPPGERLLLLLRYLITGDSLTEMHRTFHVGISTASQIIEEVCEILWKRLAPLVILDDSAENWMTCAKNFNENTHFPHCIGAIDGKHIRVLRPTEKGYKSFKRYKNYKSIILFGMCDSNYLFRYVDIGSFECIDGSSFKESTLYKNLINGSLNIPPPSPIGESIEYFPYVIVADEGFPLSENIMRPYSGKQLTEMQKIFNYRLSRARQYIECTFGIITKKWRILHRPLDVKIEFAEKIVKAICVLHNFIQKKEMSQDFDYEDKKYLRDFYDDNKGRGTKACKAIRDKFAHYFVNDNSLKSENQCI